MGRHKRVDLGALPTEAVAIEAELKAIDKELPGVGVA